nr:hypothetical protein [Candidatus Sigynarchaeota archaeon]
MKKSLFIVLWALPFVSAFLVFAMQATVVGILYTRLAGMMATGLLLFIVGGVVLLFRGLLQSKSVRVGFFLLNGALLGFFTYTLWLAAFTGYRLLWGFAAWGTGAGVYDILAERKEPRKQNWKQRFGTWVSVHISRRQFRTSISYMGIMVLFAGPGTLMMTAPAWNCQTREFTVTPQQAQQTDLVMYYACGTPNEYTTHHYVVDVAKELNVTLSLAWPADVYYDLANGTLGHEMADFIRIANAKGVPIEMFPLFDNSWEYIIAGRYFPGINLTLNWYGYWSLFQNWTARENLTVNYVLWDIEGGSLPSEIANMGDLYPLVAVLGLAQRARETPAVRAEFDRILAETAAMGAKTRITTWDPTDAMDGDEDIQLLDGQVGYIFLDLIANESIEYVSTMSYTNHWGDIPPEQLAGHQAVYENARMLRRLHPNHVGICLGNINGAGLTTIEAVVNEVNLAIAGGVTCVRLFNGASWVNGWSYVVEGPVWGFNGTRALFTACRQGGIGRFTEYAKPNADRFSSVLLDVGLNLFKI